MHGFSRAFLDKALVASPSSSDCLLLDLAGNSFTSGPFLAILVATLLHVPALPAKPKGPAPPTMGATDEDLGVDVV